MATEQFGRIVFKPTKTTGTGCFSSFSIKDRSGKVLWEVVVDHYIAPPCDSKFPITYGVIPKGMTEKVRPMPLESGVTYEAEGWAGDSYSGAFRFKQGIIVENLPATANGS